MFAKVVIKPTKAVYAYASILLMFEMVHVWKGPMVGLTRFLDPVGMV